MTQRKFAFRSLALLLICCFVLTFAALPQQAQAIAIADDVALMLLVGALSAVGITGAAVTAAELKDGIHGLVGEYESTRGLLNGTVIGSIANTAIALGAGAYQLGNTAWEHIQNFIDWIKGEKGLTEETPVESDNSPKISIGGIDFPIITNYRVSYSGSSSVEISVLPGNVKVIQHNGQLPSYTGINEEGNEVTAFVQTVSSGFAYSGMGFGNVGGYWANSRTIGFVIWQFSGKYYLRGFQGVDRVTDGEYVLSSNNAVGWTRALPYLGTAAPTVTDTGGWTITQDYPDDAEPLTYVPDLPLNVRIPGVAAGDLEGIAAGITEAVDAGELEAAGSEGVDVGEVNDYGVSLSSFFPFCIPFDLYNLVHVLDAEPIAPYIEIPLDVSLGSGQATLSEIDERNAIVIDLSGWENTARILRTMELILCAIGLALLTGKVIKW